MSRSDSIRETKREALNRAGGGGARMLENVVRNIALVFGLLEVTQRAMDKVWARGMDNNIFTQIGFVVLVGLACKNAVLIVEFAQQQREKGLGRLEAAVEAARLRLRPILMTSFAFIFGVLPLAVAKGAGAEMRQAIGNPVFFGMIGVTIFGLFLTPVFYVVLIWLQEKINPGAHTAHAKPASEQG